MKKHINLKKLFISGAATIGLWSLCKYIPISNIDIAIVRFFTQYFDNDTTRLGAIKYSYHIYLYIGLIISLLFSIKNSFKVWINYLYIPVYTLTAIITVNFFKIWDLWTIRGFMFLNGIYLVNLLIESIQYSSLLKQTNNKLRLTSKKRYKTENLTTMFVDIQNFTNISEELNDPRLIGFFLNNYFTFIEDSIIKYNGVLDKILGDGVLLVFRGRKGPENAINCGLYLLKNKEEFIKYLGSQINKHKKDSKLYKKILTALRKYNFDIRIGVSTGKVLLGKIGGNFLNNTTIIGDTVNTAARLEAINKRYNTNLLCSKATIDKLNSSFLYRLIDKIQVKGKENFIYIYQPVANFKENIRTTQLTKKDVKIWDQAIKNYLNKNFEKAYEQLSHYQIQGSSDPVTKVFTTRIKKIINRETIIRPDRDGVWKYTTK